jgi:hypothetical protein
MSKSKPYPLPPGWTSTRTPFYAKGAHHKSKVKKDGDKPPPVKLPVKVSEESKTVILGILYNVSKVVPLTFSDILRQPPVGRPKKGDEGRMAARKVAIFIARQKGVPVAEVATMFNTRYNTVSLTHNAVKRIAIPPENITGIIAALT